MLKLSNFLQTRKIIFTTNGVEYIEPKIEGEIIPFIIDDERLKLIMEEIPEKDSKGDMLMYRLLPLLINIENDIEFEEFVGLMATPNRNGFEVVLELTLSILDDVLSRANNISRLDGKMKSIKVNHEDLFKLIETEELVEEKIVETVQKPKIKKKRAKKVIELTETTTSEKSE